MKKRAISCLMAAVMTASVVTGCGSSVVDQAKQSEAATTAAPAETKEAAAETTEAAKELDLSKTIDIKVNFAAGNKSRTMTFNQESPLTLPDGNVLSAGMLKPMWTYIGEQLNVKFQDVTVQDIKATDMIQTESTSNFGGAQIFGGNSIAEQLMYYGTEGKFVNLSEMMEKGNMPNFKAFLDENPDVKSAITAYDGGIYHIPYIAELNNFARTFVIRGSWVSKLLDNPEAVYETADFATYYEGAYVGDNKRTGENGGTVTPKKGVDIVKKTDANIIEIQNALDVKNGETLTKALIQYIADNYDYENPSELYVGEKAAYDIDEMIALMRCIKANPALMSDGKVDTVWPLFVRQASYREDLLRLSTYFNGTRVHGADSYGSRWAIDKDGKLQYTYTEEGIYDTLTYLSQMEAEGLIYSDCYDITVKTNFRSTLWGTDEGDAPSFGFMTYDWISSSTSDSLNKDTMVILPPVAKINGVWQYFIDNGRAIKPDGWAISAAGCADEEVLTRACAVLDYLFSEEGHVLQNYGLPMNLEEGAKYVGPDGTEYPKFNQWALDSAKAVAKGDMSTFLRDWLGAQMPIGYQKEIGFELQTTSDRGFDGWALLQGSTCGFATYAGNGPEGENPNYYKMVPPIVSLTSRQKETLAGQTAFETDDIVEFVFNVVRFKTKGNAPQGVVVANTYEEYVAEFEKKGLELYEQTYQTAYDVMKMGQ